MLLNWLKKRKKPVLGETSVWSSTQAKMNGLCDRIIDARRREQAVLVVAHFSDTLAELTSAMDARSIPWEPLTDRPIVPNIRRGLYGQANVWLVFSDMLRDEQAPPPAQRQGELSIFVSELHPLPARHEWIATFAGLLPFNTRLQTHTAFTEPVLKLFVGPAIRNLLSTLGLDENEAVSHRMVTGAIERAQQKIKRRALGDSEAETARQWLEQNLPAA